VVTAPYPGLLDDMRNAGFVGCGKVVSNPVDLRRYQPASLARRVRLRERHGLTGPVVLYAGRLALEKHVDVVIRAIARLRQRHPRLTLVLTGFGSAEPGLRALVSASALVEHVRFVGHVSPERLVELYQAADVFAMLSTAETQCLALMNAYACGLPVVAAGSRALPYYVPPQCGFVVAPGNDEAAAHSIDRLLCDADLRLRMGASAFSFVQAFSVEAVANAWTDIYASTARRRVSPFSAEVET
jgi:glycosyltransferase involved in cell wall biosynthesis